MNSIYNFIDYGDNEFKPEDDICFCCNRNKKDCDCTLDEMIQAEIAEEQGY